MRCATRRPQGWGRPLWWAFGVALSVSIMSGCTSGASRHPTLSLLELRRENVVIQQWDLSCGAAALATLLTHQHGDPVPEKTIAEAMLRRTDPLRVQVRGGFSLLDLKRFADSRGLVGNGYGKMTLETLTGLGPAIVPIRTKGYNHFVVFRGVQDGRILLSDPAFGKRTMTPERFEEIWLGKLAFTVERPDGPAPPGRLAPDGDQILLPPDALLRTAIR